jgi:hypothetical protein
MGSNLLAPLRTWGARRTLRLERRQADEDILASRRPSPRLAWRTAELVAPNRRTTLGRELIAAVHAADERRLPGASPLDRSAIRVCRSELLELASRLCALERPVTPRGVILTERLLHDSSGPLYGHGDPDRLRGDARRASSALTGADLNGSH